MAFAFSPRTEIVENQAKAITISCVLRVNFLPQYDFKAGDTFNSLCGPYIMFYHYTDGTRFHLRTPLVMSMPINNSNH